MADEHLGQDFGGALDIDPSLSTVKGRRATAERIARRWYDLAGSLWYDRDYGKGLEAYLNAAIPESDIAGQLEDEALKDEQIEDCAVTVTRTGESLRILGRLVDANGPFDFTVEVSRLNARVLMENVQ